MKVYIVKILWRNDDDFGCDIELFKTKDKAKRYYSKEIVKLMDDFNTGIGDDNLDLGNGWDAEYVTGDQDYFTIYIDTMEVK